MKTCEDRLHLAGDGLKVQCSRETEGQIEGQFDYARLRLGLLVPGIVYLIQL